MDSETVVLFEEKQKFTQLWLWIVLGGVWGIDLIPLYQSIQLYGWAIFRNPAGLIGSGILLLIMILFLWVTLVTVVTREGITVRFMPFVKNRFFPRDAIAGAEVVTYNPLLDYGGWGLRRSFRNGTAYNVKGNQGVRLHLKNGKIIMIGTQEPAAMQKAITQMLEREEA